MKTLEVGKGASEAPPPLQRSAITPSFFNKPKIFIKLGEACERATLERRANALRWSGGGTSLAPFPTSRMFTQSLKPGDQACRLRLIMVPRFFDGRHSGNLPNTRTLNFRFHCTRPPSPAFFCIAFNVSGIKEVMWWVSSWPSANVW